MGNQTGFPGGSAPIWGSGTHDGGMDGGRQMEIDAEKKLKVQTGASRSLGFIPKSALYSNLHPSVSLNI